MKAFCQTYVMTHKLRTLASMRCVTASALTGFDSQEP